MSRQGLLLRSGPLFADAELGGRAAVRRRKSGSASGYPPTGAIIFLMAALFTFVMTDRRAVGQDEAVPANDNGAAEDDAGKGNGSASGASLLTRSAAPQVPVAIETAMQDREYEKAIAAIDAALAKKQGDAEYLAYLKGRAFHLAERYDDAIATLEQFDKAHGKGPWARRARFARALAHARKGEFQEAEKIYRVEAQYLLSLDRKQEIADIYIEFAETYFKPPREDQQPNYETARQFYERALEVGPKPERRIEIELRVAECWQKLSNFAEAIQRYERFIRDHSGDPSVVEARYQLGQSQLQNGDPVSARRTWQDLLALHAASESPRLAEAAYHLADTYGLPNAGDDESLNLGVAALRAFLAKYPDHKLAAEAHLKIVQSQANRGRYEEAVKSAQQFLADERYKDAEQTPAAQAMLGFSFQAQGKLDEALAAWRDFLAKYPTHSQWSSVQGAIVNTEFLKAETQFREKNYDEARKLFGEFLVKYPLDPRNASIQLRLGTMLHAEEKWDEAIAQWRRLISKYPQTNEASRAQFLIAATLEENIGKLEDALAEYRKVTGVFQGRAAQRISRLTARSLKIATERVFRTDETPQIKVTTRNIEKLNVAVYTVDLETYFRKMHLAGNVEQLDTSLIDPDARFEFSVPKFAQYQQFENSIDVLLPMPAEKAPVGRALLPDEAETDESALPAADDEQVESDKEGAAGGDAKEAAAANDAPGVMVVTVSSDTLEATTLVLRTDLEIVVKSSRDELFVFAENLRTGKPWEGVRLLASDGQQVFGEGTTGDDGVFRQSFDELKSAGDVRVFAISDGNTASNIVGLGGVGVARGLERKGYIFTDRTAYRPGQMVHVRGVIRDVEGDTYQVPAGREYRVEIHDGRDRLLHEASAKLNDFGSFHISFLIPDSAPQGACRIDVRHGDSESHQGAFQVVDYQLEPAYLEVDAERSVFYRGEEISGVIRAAYYYGAPLAGRDVTYQLADGRSFTAKTDDKGEIHFSLPTRDYRESQQLVLNATLPAMNLSATKVFYLSTVGFSVALETPRETYLQGESFEITARATDAEGEPLATGLHLRALKQTEVNGKVGETTVFEQDVKTDDEGLARVTLKLDEGGSYILRAEGEDRFGNPISSDLALHISDDKDSVRLRILADRHTYRVGDSAELQLHWREKPALALITYEGARILRHQLVSLKTGANKLNVPMSAELAPNFELAVAVMTDDVEPVKDGPPPSRLHVASSPFSVTRDLRVSVDVRVKGDAKRTPQPGDEVEAVVTAVDSQGKPVAAELSLAMVEKSLLERFPNYYAAIDAFFRGEPRITSMRTTGSIVFAYRPRTRPIDAALLAERERREIAEEESRRLSELEDLAAVIDSVDGSGAALSDDDGEVAGDDLFATDASAAGGDPFGPDMDANMDRSVAASEFAYNQADFQNAFGPMAQSGGYAMPGMGMASGMGGGAGFGGQLPQMQRQLALGAINGVDSAPQTWNSVGGPGTTNNFNGDISLHFEQTQRVMADQRVFTDGLSRSYALFAGRAAGDNGRLGELRNKAAAQWGFAADGGTWADGDMQVMNTKGEWFNVNLSGKRPAAAENYVKQLQAEGAVFLPGLRPHETGYWNPSVTTDAKGNAVVAFVLPERSTAWSMRAVGVTTDTLAGEATKDFTVRKPLFGQLKLPASLTDGDSVRVEATVHNDAVDAGPIEVELKATIGDKTVTQKKTIDDAKRGVHDLSFDVQAALPEKGDDGVPGADVVFELTVAAGDERDVVSRSVPLRPYGMTVFAVAGGSAESDALSVVEPPKEMKLQSPRLQIVIGPTVERSLLDAILAPPIWCSVELMQFSPGDEFITGDLMAALALQKLMADSRDAGHPQADQIDARIRSAIGSLISSQRDDGGWSWAGGAAGQGESHPYMTSRVVWALSLARQSGYRVDEGAFDKGLNFVRTKLAEAAVSDYETKSVLLHALTVAGRDDFTLANQLYRNRPSLSSTGLAYLALAFSEMDRQPTAIELLGLIAERKFSDVGGGLAWLAAEAELRALVALGLDRVSPGNPRLREQIDWLMAHRTGSRWSPEKATGPAMQAVCRWFARTKFQGEAYKLTIFVNDLQAAELSIDDNSLTQTVDVPAELLKEGKQSVRLQLTGRGRFTYQCVLGGFVPGDELKKTTSDWYVTRRIEPAPLEMDGEPIPRGFDIVRGQYTHFRNALTQLPVGRRGQVTLNVVRTNTPAAQNDATRAYLVVTEPLPAGVSVVENSIRGAFDRYELSPGAITFFFGSRQHGGEIYYDVYGYLPGKYRAAPTVVRDAYRPDQIAVAAPLSLDAIGENEASKDEYRLTPRELYELGRRRFDKGDFAAAGAHLNQLLKDWTINDGEYRESVRMLLDVHLKLGPAADVVKYFEIIIEKYPDLEISFAKLLQVADAYDELAEYERSYLVFRATIEASFLRESQLGGFLESQQEFLRSVDVMSSLMRQYPPEPYLATAEYALAQRIFAKGLEAAGDQKLREKKITRVDLVAESRRRLDVFLTAYANDPAADQASFSLANALLELEQYQPAIDRCTRFAERYPQSEYLDSYWYITGFGHYALGRHDEALAMCNKVAEYQPADPASGLPRESRNKWQAIYILGQIHHSLGEAADAITEYRRVEERFADARQAIEYFLRKDLSLPEIAAFEPGKPVEVELKFRNVAEADVTVYRIDLLKFSLLRRDLSDITNINLAGIRPQYETRVKLGDGRDYRDRTNKLDLPLKDEGAYLVVCRGENLYASSMVLVSPLKLEVQEEASSGRVRATVRDAAADKYVHDVLVKVIGSRSGEFISGETDLRGVFVADGVLGRSMVIARAGDGRYAFFRGQQELGPPPQPEQPNAAAQQEAAPSEAEDKPSGGKEALLQNLRMDNSMIQGEQQKNLDTYYKNDVQEGVGGGFGGGFF